MTKYDQIQFRHVFECLNCRHLFVIYRTHGEEGKTVRCEKCKSANVYHNQHVQFCNPNVNLMYTTFHVK